jgi:hypothetical protein
MYMAGYDRRFRKFEPLRLLQERGVDLNTEKQSGKSVILKLSYNCTFNKKVEAFDIQEYKWNRRIQQWEIV